MGTQNDGKVRRYSYPSFTVYFNKTNEHIYKMLMNRLERGQVSQWVIDACLLRLQEENLANRVIAFLEEHGAARLTQEDNRPLTTPGAPPLADSFGDFDA